MDSANERIADLKRAVAEAQAAAQEARAIADEAEEELAILRSGDADKQDSLRCVICGKAVASWPVDWLGWVAEGRASWWVGPGGFD